MHSLVLVFEIVIFLYLNKKLTISSFSKVSCSRQSEDICDSFSVKIASLIFLLRHCTTSPLKILLSIRLEVPHSKNHRFY